MIRQRLNGTNMTVGPWPTLWTGAERLARAAETETAETETETAEAETAETETAETETAEAATETVERGSAERLARQRAAALRQQAGQRAARDGLQVGQVLPRGQVRLARPGADHQPGEPQLPCRDGLEGEGGLVEGAEACGGDHEHRCAEHGGEIGERGAGRVVADQQAARPLDQDQVAGAGELADIPGRVGQVKRRQAADA